MTRPPPAPARAPRRVGARLAAAGLASFGLTLGAGACLDRPVAPASPRTSNAITERVAVERINKIDLVFMIDNSISMADKQSILASAVPDLLKRFISPNCVTSDGATPTPVGPDGKCAVGVREFEPVADIHIGVVSSSLGGHGGTVCLPEPGSNPNDNAELLARQDGSADPVPTYKNLGFLAWDQLGASGGEQNADVLQANFATIVKGVGQKGCGFEASLEGWYRFLVDPSPPLFELPPKDPNDPKGIARVATLPVLKEIDQKVLQQRADFLRPDSLVAVIALSDENDCSFIESFYPSLTRGESGLVEPWPEPYLKHLLVGAGPGKQTFVANGFQLNINNDGLFEGGTGACKDDPYSPNCFSCGYLNDPQASPEVNAAARAAAGCQEFADNNAKAKFDRVNQRCFQQRKRFGFEALHPVQRYIDALTQRKIYDTSGALIALSKAAPDATDAKFFADDNPTNRVAGNIVAPKVDNPLFVDLPWRRYEASCTGEGDAKVCQLPKPIGREAELAQRPSGRIYFAGIVGVPWQDIAVNPTTLESAPGRPGGFQPPGAINWDLILGPALAGRVTEFGEPLDPLMKESIDSRIEGTALGNPKNIHPVTKEDLAGPWNKINGHEWTNPIADDLQYACIFPLVTDVECNPPEGQPKPEACDCTQALGSSETDPAVRKNPLCEAYTGTDPTKPGGSGTFTTLQARAKAYPGSRFLEVLKGIGDSAVVASICPEEIRPTENARDNFGYRPAVNAIIDRLKNALKGRCLPRRLDVQDNKTPCLVIEARYARDANGVSQASATDIASCQQCTAPGYTTLSPELRATLQAQSTPTPNDDPTDFECLCQFQQLTDDGLRVCQTNPGDPSSISGVNGWCYVDPLLAASEEDRTLQNEIVKDCAGSEKRTLRFIGTQPSTGSTDESTSVFITCLGAASNSLPVVTPTTPTP